MVLRIYEESFDLDTAPPPLKKRRIESRSPSLATDHKNLESYLSNNKRNAMTQTENDLGSKCCIYCKPSEVTILDLTGDALISISEYCTKKERRMVSMTCRQLHAFFCGNSRFTKVSIDWRSQVQKVEGVHIGTKFAFTADPYVKETTHFMRMFKHSRAEMLTVKFNEQIDSLMGPFSTAPSSDMLSNLLQNMTYERLEAHFNCAEDYTSKFSSTFIERPRFATEIKLVWDSAFSHDIEQVRIVLGKLPKVEKMTIEWKLVDGKMPALSDDTCLLNDELLRNLARSHVANIMAYGNFTAKTILGLFEKLGKYDGQRLIFYATDTVIDEIFAMEHAEYEKNVHRTWKSLYDKKRGTKLSACDSQICIEDNGCPYFPKDASTNEDGDASTFSIAALSNRGKDFTFWIR